MTGGDGDSDELTFLPWHSWPDRMRSEDLYSLNPIFTSPFGQAVPDPWFFSVRSTTVPEIWLLRLLDEPKNICGQGLHMRGNATFTAADLSAGSAGVAALAKKFGGARAIWCEILTENWRYFGQIFADFGHI